MLWKAVVFALFLPAVLLHSQQLPVSLCNFGQVGNRTLDAAREEVTYIFQSAGVKVVWRSCDADSDSQSHATPSDFVIRLRTDMVPNRSGPVSLHSMGRAFVSNGQGYLADAYIRAIESTAERKNADVGVLLGFVIAHELGHLLLGPGHSESGIMRGVWSDREISALVQRGIKFKASQAEIIVRQLRSKSANALQEPRPF